MSDPKDEREDQPLLAETLQQHRREAVETCDSSYSAQSASADSVPVLRAALEHRVYLQTDLEDHKSDLSRAKLALYGSHFLSTWGQVTVHR